MSSLESGFPVALPTVPVDDTTPIHPVHPDQSVQPDQSAQVQQVDMDDDDLLVPQALIEQPNVPPMANDNAQAVTSAQAIDGNANANASGSNGI